MSIPPNVFTVAAATEANAQRLRLNAFDPNLMTLFDIRERFKVKCSNSCCGICIFPHFSSPSLAYIFDTTAAETGFTRVFHIDTIRCHQCKSVTFTPCGLDRLKSQDNTNHNCSRVQCTIFSWWDILAAFDDEDKRKMTVSGLYDGDDTDRDRLDQDEPFSNLLHLEAVPVRQVISLIVLLLSTPMDNTTYQDVSTMIRHSSFPLRIGNLFRNFTLEGVTVYKDLYNSVFTLLRLLAESEKLKNILSEAHIRTTRLPVLRMINDPKLFIMSTGEIFKSTRSIASCLVNLNYNASNFLKYHLDPDRNHNFREALPGTAIICEQVLDLYKAMPGKKFTLRWVYDGEMKRMPLRNACSALGETNHGSNQRTRDFLEEHVNKQIALNHDFNRRHLDFGGHELVEVEETE